MFMKLNLFIKGVVATIGLCFCVLGTSYALTITTSTTWGSSQTITGDLIIDNHAHLIMGGGASAVYKVTGSIIIKPGSMVDMQTDVIVKIGESIIVESASTLNGLSAILGVSGSTITALNTKWNGIEVWGNLGYGFQGSRAKVGMNNATIEKAVVGVATYHVNASGFISKRGGCVQVDQSVFKNNLSSIIIRENPDYYLTSQNGPAVSVPANNPSYIYQCQFLSTTTDNPFYPYPQTSGDIYMVKLYDAKVIKIAGCTFDGQADELVLAGIATFNAGTEIGPFFGYGGQPVYRCTFKNLDAAVSVASPGTFTHVVVERNDIENCYTGIWAGSGQNVIILNNHIYDGGIGSGINLGRGATSFTVEGNTIEDYMTGVYLRLISDQNNEIYKNTIRNYYWGVLYLINNPAINQPSPVSEGLRVLCNDMRNASKPSVTGIRVEGKMAAYQGVWAFNVMSVPQWLSAGNLFAGLSKGDPQIVKFNSAPSFTYFYNTANSAEYPGNTAFPLMSKESNNCPVHTPPIIIPDNSIYAIKMANLENQIFRLEEKPSLSADDSSLLSGLLYNHQKLIDSMVYTLMYHEDTIDLNKLAFVFEQAQYGYENKVRLAGVYLTQLKYGSAIDLLNSIPVHFSLTEDEQIDVQDMAEMYTVIDTLAHNGDSWSLLPSEMKQNVHDVANGPGRYGSGVAIYLLSRYEHYKEEMKLPAEAQRYTTNDNELPVHDKIYPNPTNGNFLIDWQSDKKLSIKIYSITGEEVMRQAIHSGLSKIDVHSLNSGFYFVHVYEEGKSVYQQKIIKK